MEKQARELGALEGGNSLPHPGEDLRKDHSRHEGGCDRDLMQVRVFALDLCFPTLCWLHLSK